MTKNMYEPSKKKYGECSYDNETLAVMIQSGDAAAAELLLSQNEGYLTNLALEYSDWCEPEDLKQEGALALLEAAKHFDPAYGTKLLTYATPIIQSAMADYCAHVSLAVSISSARYQQLRKVARACYEAKDDNEAAVVAAVCEKIGVSEKNSERIVAGIQDALFHPAAWGRCVFRQLRRRSCRGLRPLCAQGTVAAADRGSADAQRTEFSAVLFGYRQTG